MEKCYCRRAVRVVILPEVSVAYECQSMGNDGNLAGVLTERFHA